jgi:hypothetical protein
MIWPGDPSDWGPISRLVLALGVPDPKTRMVLVLVCKLDASGTDAENPIITMGGYVGLLTGWLDFEVQARAIFDRYEVNVLHAKEFYDTDDDFEGWTKLKKQTFVRELQDCIRGRLKLGISTSVVKAEHSRMKKDRNIGHNESAFGFCLRHTIARLVSDPVMEEAFKTGLDLTVVHESGDDNAGDAQRVFNQIKAISPEHNRRLRSFGFADKASTIGLQIGDFLAVTSRKYVGKYSETTGYPEQPAILSILRDRIYLIGDVVTGWKPDASEQPS